MIKPCHLASVLNAGFSEYRIALYKAIPKDQEIFDPENESKGVGYKNRSLGSPTASYTSRTVNIGFPDVPSVAWKTATVSARCAVIYCAKTLEVLHISDFGKTVSSTNAEFALPIPNPLAKIAV